MATRSKVTVAIDLGSTFCGYAYSIGDGPIKLNDPWAPDSGRQHLKTPTALLYNENNALEHYGFSATDNIDKRGNNFHRFFKKSAEATRVFNLTSTFKNQSGLEKNTIDLYADVLRELKEHCLKKIEESELGERPQLHEIFWILPVPVIWEIHEREFMIAAAMQAGLITEMKATNIMIMLEGDAAYAFCTELDPTQDLAVRLSDYKAKRIAEATNILVLDAGGKTVDATTKMNMSPRLKRDFIPFEKLHPSGFSVGGESINLAFEERMGQVLGAGFIRHLKEQQLPLWLMFMGEFEVKKKVYMGDDSIVLSDACVSNLDRAFDRWAKTQNKQKTLSDILESDKNALVLDGYQRLRIPKRFVDELFHETVQSITNFIIDQLDREKIEVIYLAGGFASSPYLQSKIQEAVAGRAVVVIPKNPERAVLEGAIYYSRAQRSIDTFDVDANYGVITKEYRNMDQKALHPHILEEGTTVLQGNIHQQSLYRDELEDANCLTIYRDGDTFLQFDLEPLQNIMREKRPTVKVCVQKIRTAQGLDLLQATVIDGLTQDCYIKREILPSGLQYLKALPRVYHATLFLFAFVVAVIVLCRDPFVGSLFIIASALLFYLNGDRLLQPRLIKHGVRYLRDKFPNLN